MKKLLVLMMALVMTLSLVACGGADKAAAKEAYNKAQETFNEAGDMMNENIDMFSEEEIQVMNDMASVLNQHADLLSGDTEIKQEKLDEMIAWYKTVDDWATKVVDALK